MSDLSWLTHTPCNRCVRFATTVARGHATLATKRTLLLTWAGLPPAGSHQLCLAHSFDHLVRSREQGYRYIKAERRSSLEVDDQFELGCKLHRKFSRLFSLENTIDVRRGASVKGGEI